MLAKDEKTIILAIGAGLITLTLITFSYPVGITSAININYVVSYIYPYRQYSLPFGVVGVIVLAMGLILSVRASKKITV